MRTRQDRVAGMKRDIFTPEHDLFREQFRRFAEKEIAPKVAQWNERGTSDRETWRKLGAAGSEDSGSGLESGIPALPWV